MFAALIVRRRAEAAWRRAFELQAFKESVERKIEIEARLFAIRDYVEAGGDLIVNRRDDGVLLHLRDIRGPELAEMRACELEP